MEKIRLCIVTDDAHYGRALAAALQECHRGFVLELMGKDPMLRRWRAAGWRFREEYDLILWDGEEIQKLYEGNVIWLTERRRPEREDPSGAGSFCLYKYDRGSAMTAEIFRILSRLTGRKTVAIRPEKVRLIAFASWQGGAGCTGLARSMGRELVRFFGKRTLYLSLDAMEAGEELTDEEEKGGVGEFLYHLFHGGRSGQLPLLEGYVIRDGYGLEALAPSAGRNPLPGLGRQEMDHLLSAVMGSGRYDVILMDTGNCFGESAMAALSAADRICICGRSWEPKRFGRFTSCLASEGIEEEGKGIFLWTGEGEAPVSSGREWVSAAEDIHALADRIWYNNRCKKSTSERIGNAS